MPDEPKQSDSGAPLGGIVELPRIPATGPLYRRAVLGLAPGPGRSRRADSLPDVELVVRGVAVDRDHLAAYDRVCGFRLRDTLPATYPHIVAFPLALRLMSASEFPFPLVGLVHLANRITISRPVDAGEPLDLAVRAIDLRPHHRGRQLDVVTTASVGGELVWRGVSTYLRRERPATGGEQRAEGGAGRDPDREGGIDRDRDGEGAPRGAGDRPPLPAASAHWRVEPRVGTEYARVSGDRNPIHTSRLAARLLGFRRPIAHGMWSKARCLAALDGRLPDAYTVDVAFKSPIALPGTIVFHAATGSTSATEPADATDSSGITEPAGATGSLPATAAWTFALSDERSGRPHLIGSVR